jgi:peptide/nickel transport system ATP-binding protein
MPVFQDPVASLDRRWPIWRSITEPATVNKRLSRQERLQLAGEALARVRLGELDPYRLPGQLRRVPAGSHRPGADRSLVAHRRRRADSQPRRHHGRRDVDLLRLTRQSGLAIALVSHDEALLAAVADRSCESATA